MMKINVCVGAALACAGAAMGGYSNGDIVFTDAPNDAIRVIRAGSGMLETLHTFNDPTNQIRLADITRVDGRFYVNSGFADADLGVPGQLIEVQHLFGASSASTFSSGNMLQNPIGLGYHRGSDQFLSVNNTGQTAMQTAPDFDGIIGTSRADGTQTFRFDEQIGDPTRPRYQAGAQMTRIANDRNRFLVASVNGGELRDDNLPSGDFNKASALYSVDVDITGNTSVNLWVDFSTTDFGPLTFVRGVTSGVGMDGLLDVYVSDGSTNALYHIDTDANGDVVAINQLLDGLDNPGELIYNEYNDSLVFSGVGDSTISEYFFSDGSVTTLATGVTSRGFYIVPAPGAAALFGLAGLAAYLPAVLGAALIVLAALLFGALTQGGTELDFEFQTITRETVQVVQGLIILFSGALAYLFAPWLARALAPFLAKKRAAA